MKFTRPQAALIARGISYPTIRNERTQGHRNARERTRTRGALCGYCIKRKHHSPRGLLAFGMVCERLIQRKYFFGGYGTGAFLRWLLAARPVCRQMLTFERLIRWASLCPEHTSRASSASPAVRERSRSFSRECRTPPTERQTESAKLTEHPPDMQGRFSETL